MVDSWISTHASGVIDGVVATAIWVLGGAFLHYADRVIANRFTIPAAYKAYVAIAIFFIGLFFAPAQDDWLARLFAFILAAGSLGFVLRAMLNSPLTKGLGP